MKTLKKLLATTIISGIAMITPALVSANTIVNYTIAPQDLISIYSGALGGAVGSIWGTFTADFDTRQITAVNMFIRIMGDATYVFETPRAFGDYTDPSFPGVSYYEADLGTATPGISTGTFYMDFLQDNTTQLFPGHMARIHTSFGNGRYILDNTTGISANPSAPEPSSLVLVAVGAIAVTRMRNNLRRNQLFRV